MLTTPYVFSTDDSARSPWRRAGADIIVCHLGLTTGGRDRRGDGGDAGTVARRWSTNGPMPPLSRSMTDAIVLVHGGPVAMPDDAEFVLKNTKNCHGFYGASSMERLPTEVALTEQTRNNSSKISR